MKLGAFVGEVGQIASWLIPEELKQETGTQGSQTLEYNLHTDVHFYCYSSSDNRVTSSQVSRETCCTEGMFKVLQSPTMLFIFREKHLGYGSVTYPN